MNPWKIIGWIVLVVIVLFLAFCSLVVYNIGKHAPENQATPQPSPTIASKPAGSLTVVSFECISKYNRDSAKMTVRNTGPVEIPYSKLFVEFKDKAGKVQSAADSYFRPHTIPVGSTASATVYSSSEGAYTCAPSTIQDGDGHTVHFSK